MLIVKSYIHYSINDPIIIQSLVYCGVKRTVEYFGFNFNGIASIMSNYTQTSLHKLIDFSKSNIFVNNPIFSEV
jgi:hypothetical protein